MSGLFVSQPPFPFQVWPDLEWNQDSAYRPGELLRQLTRLCFLLLPLGRLSLFSLPHLLGTCLPVLWSPPFSLNAPAQTPSLSLRCGSRSPSLSPSIRSGALDRRLCSFSFWQGRLWRTCQLLSLWYWGHSFLFNRPSMLKFFRWSLRHSASSLLISAAPTSLPFLFSSPTVWLSLCPRRLVLSSIFPLISNFVADLAGTVFSALLFYQATMGFRTLVSPGKRHSWWAGQTGSATRALCNLL